MAWMWWRARSRSPSRSRAVTECDSPSTCNHCRSMKEKGLTKLGATCRPFRSAMPMAATGSRCYRIGRYPCISRNQTTPAATNTWRALHSSIYRSTVTRAMKRVLNPISRKRRRVLQIPSPRGDSSSTYASTRVATTKRPREFGKTFFNDLFYSVPAGDIDVDLPVTVSFEDYLSGDDPVLDAVSSQ